MFTSFLVISLFAAPLSVGQETSGAPKPRKEELICKINSETGSRLRRTRVCKSKWQARVDEERAQREVNGVRSLQTQAPAETPF